LTEIQENTDNLKGTLYNGDPASIESDHPEAHAALTDFVGAFTGRNGTRGILAQIKAGNATYGLVKQAAEKNPVLQGILDSEDGPAKMMEILKHYGTSSSPAASPRGGGRGRRRRDEISPEDEPPVASSADSVASEYRGPEYLSSTHSKIHDDLRTSTREMYDEAKSRGVPPEKIRQVQASASTPAHFLSSNAGKENIKNVIETFKKEGTDISEQQAAELLAHYHKNYSGVEPASTNQSAPTNPPTNQPAPTNPPTNPVDAAKETYRGLSPDAKRELDKVKEAFASGKKWSEIERTLSPDALAEIRQFKAKHQDVFRNLPTHHDSLTKSFRRKTLLRKSKTPAHPMSVVQRFRVDPPQRSTSDIQAEELARLMNRMYGYGVNQSLAKIDNTFKRK
jgi:hypothetical protein